MAIITPAGDDPRDPESDALIGLLDPEATAIADGGGIVSAELRPIEGGEQIARAFLDVAGKAPDLTLLERTVNGEPGLVASKMASRWWWRSASQATGSSTSGQYGILRSCGLGRRADARPAPSGQREQYFAAIRALDLLLHRRPRRAGQASVQGEARPTLG